MQDRFLVKLLQLRRRQAWVDGVRAGLVAGRWGGWTGLAMAVLLASWRLPLELCAQALICWPAAASLGFLWGLSRPRSLGTVAHLADTRNHLQERLLTCYSHYAEQRRSSAVSQMLWQDTLPRLEALDPRLTFPNHWQRPLAGWLLPGLLWLSGWLAWPHLPRPRSDPWEAEVLASRQRMMSWRKKLDIASAGRRRDLDLLMQRAPHLVSHQLARQLRLQQRKGQQALEELQKLGEPLRRLEQGQLSAGEARKVLGATDPQRLSQLEPALKALEQGDSGPLREQLQALQRETQQELALQQALQQELSQLPGSEAATAEGEGTQGEDSQAQGRSQGEKGRPGAGPGQNGKPGPAGDFGQGSTHRQQASSERTPKAQSERQSDRRSDRQGDFRRLYGVERHHLPTRRERARLTGAQGRLLGMPESARGEAVRGVPSLRPEQQDFLQAKVAAEQSVAEEQIPPEHREAVRRYFDQVDPR